MTDNDDWHAGYREGLRDGRNISTELAPSTGRHPDSPGMFAAQPQGTISPEYTAELGRQLDELESENEMLRHQVARLKATQRRLFDGSAAPPQCAQVNEETLVDFLCEAQDRAGPGCDELAIAQALLATFSVTRPESNTP